MKKLFIALFSVTILLSSCGGKGGNTGNTDGVDSTENKSEEVVEEKVSASSFPNKEVDYQMLSNEADLKKAYGMILTKLGDNVKAVDKITMSVRRPAHEGRIIRKNEPDNLNLDITYLYPEDKKKLFNVNYYSGNKNWDEGSVRSVQLVMGDAEKFRLEDEMFDMSPLTPDVLYQIVQDALKKYKDESKYSYQYVNYIRVDKKGVSVDVYGKLSANDLEKKNIYRATLTGKKK